MAVRTQMRPTRSVRDQVLLLLLSMVLVVCTVAAAGAVGVTALTDDVSVLVDDMRPAAYSNVALRNDMTQAQSGALAYALTGDSAYTRRYRDALTQASVELGRLTELAAGDPAVAGAVEVQSRALEQWKDFADGLGRHGRKPVATAYLLDGFVAFDRFVERNDAVSAMINARIDAKADDARSHAGLVVLLVTVFSLLGLAVTAVLGRNLVRRVSTPLQDMELAVERLASGYLETRVSTDGPREIRGVATALNTLAEENQRSRDMEEQVLEQLKQLDRAKDEFVSTVSHELRTPLTSIAGYVELFEDGFVQDMSPQQSAMLGVVQRNVDRLRLLIEDLLTLSRVEAEAFRTSFEVLDLSLVTSDVAHDVAEIAARAQVRVRESGPGQPVLVNGDVQQLSRAVLNLVTNAIKFSPPGSQVLIRLTELDGKAAVSVIDQGIGIPAEELATLGTRFYRASNAVEAEITGTGLGLRIVQTIADNHGGCLELESAEGAGTTARLVVPVLKGNIPTAEDLSQG